MDGFLADSEKSASRAGDTAAPRSMIAPMA
jgi:hypothetical protein